MLNVVLGDITEFDVDAIVNAANSSLAGGGGVDGAIHLKAGEKLYDACKKIGHLDVGKACITPGFNLKARYIIHTVGPIYYDYDKDEAASLLMSAYKSSLLLASSSNIRSIAFPVISSGAYGYPFLDAFRLACKSIREFLFDNDMDVYLVIYNKPNLNYSFECVSYSYSYSEAFSFKDVILDESFSDCLFRFIKKKRMDPVLCYKRANISKQLFSKINSNSSYHPSKSTAISFCLALKLNKKESDELLNKAGFVLSDSDLSDVIVNYFISNKIYDIDELNLVLIDNDLKPLSNY